MNGGNPLGSSTFTDRNWAILDALKAAAAALTCPPARVALAWTSMRPGVDALLLGASRPEQVRENIAALSLDLPAEHRVALDAASALEPAFPYLGFNDEVKRSIFGGSDVAGWDMSRGYGR